MESDTTAEDLYAELYDATGVGWPGELAFYRDLAAAASARGKVVLEVACGTGRVAADLSASGARVTGFDRSPAMIRVASRRRSGSGGLRWAVADMRDFDLGERFGLVLVPAHAFQFMLTPADQLACLRAIARHLTPGGTLVLHLDHQDLDWLGMLPATPPAPLPPCDEIAHPRSGRRFRQLHSWGYDRATQTATLRLAWEEIESGGTGGRRWELDPTPLHCAFRFEVEHLLARAGFAVRGVHGDFQGNPLGQDSSEMIWVAELRGDSS